MKLAARISAVSGQKSGTLERHRNHKKTRQKGFPGRRNDSQPMAGSAGLGGALSLDGRHLYGAGRVQEEGGMGGGGGATF